MKLKPCQQTAEFDEDGEEDEDENEDDHVFLQLHYTTINKTPRIEECLSKTPPAVL